MSFYREQLEKYLSELNINAETVLDVGGRHKPVQGRTKSWNVKNYFILDLPEYDLDEEIKFEHKGDFIFCLEVFEYLINPLQGMKNIANLLKKGGKAIISFPLVYPVHNEVEKDSLRFTESGIRRLATKAGLSVEKVNYRKTKTNTLTQYYADDGMRMAKGVNHQITGYICEIKN